MTNEEMIQKLEELQKKINQSKPPSDLVVHIDDTLIVLRQLRQAGFTFKRGMSLIDTKASFFNVMLNGYIVFKVLVNLHRDTMPRGEVIVIPYSSYYPFSRDVQITRDETLHNNIMRMSESWIYC